MHIKELHIYGYGKMHDTVIRDLGKLHMFYGENEAGKSTLMSFIHSILFGFPSKNNAENRYEPKHYSAYGGKIILQTESEGEVAVQRIKGKAAGDVTLTFSDGRTGDETDLKRILQGLDKRTFQSIFSFDLQGISDIHNLNEKEVSAYLFSAGLVGNDGLLKAEKYLQDEMDKLFKPKGRTQKVNKMLSSIKQSAEKLKGAEAEQGTYSNLLDVHKQLMEEKNALEAKVADLEQEIAYSQNYLAIEPLLAEKEELQDRLAKLQNLPALPGIEEQLKQLNEASLPVDMSISSLESQLQAIKSKMGSVTVDEAFLRQKDAIMAAIGQTAVIDSLEAEKQSIKHQIKQKETEIRRHKDFAHITQSDAEILQMDTSSRKKEHISRLDRMHQKLMNDRSHLEEKQESARRGLLETNQRMGFLQDSLLPKEKREAIERKVNINQTVREAEWEAKHINETIANLEQRIRTVAEQEKREQKSRKMLLGTVAAISILGMLLCVLFNQLALLPVCLIGAGAAIWMFIKAKPASLSSDLEKELQGYKEKKAGLMRDLPAMKEGGSFAAEADLLRRDEESRQQLQLAAIRKKEFEDSFHASVDSFEKWEAEYLSYGQAVSGLLLEWGLQLKEASASQLMGIYETLTALKQAIYEHGHLVEKLDETDRQLAKITGRVVHLAGRFGRPDPESVQDAVLYLKNMTRYNERNADLLKQYEESIGHISNQLNEQKGKQAHIRKQLEQLLKEAGCEDEMELLELARALKEKEEAVTRIAVIGRQLQPYQIYIEKALVQKEVINAYTIQKLEADLKANKERLQHTIERMAEIKHRITQLEGGGTFDELSFRFHAEKSALNEEAKGWAKLALAKHMLQKVMDEYRNTKFPAILQTAGQHVGEITDGRYTRIYWEDESGSLKLQRNDGTIFDVKEVSRGTQEAVYVALRLSLAENSYPEEPMPIIIDDSFVNFDIERLRRVSAILERIGKTRQIIYFTCHEYMLGVFKKDTVTALSEKAEVK